MNKLNHTPWPWCISGVIEDRVIMSKGANHSRKVIARTVSDGDNLIEEFENRQLIVFAALAPHDCSDENCPGNVNRRKLELFNELIDACKAVSEPEWEDAADWKDAHGRLTSRCRAAVAKARLNKLI